MYDLQGDAVTREAVQGRTAAAPTVADPASAAPTTDLPDYASVRDTAGSAVVGGLAWSQEDNRAAADPMPLSGEEYGSRYPNAYDAGPGTGRVPVAVPSGASKSRRPVRRRRPTGLGRIAFGLGLLVALVAISATYALTRPARDEIAPQPETSAVVTPPLVSTAPPAPPAPPPVEKAGPSRPAPPPVTTRPRAETTTAPATTEPPATTRVPTTTAPPTTTALPTSTAPPTSTVPSTTEAPPPTSTVPMTTEYLHIPLVPIPIPITVPRN